MDFTGAPAAAGDGVVGARDTGAGEESREGGWCGHHVPAEAGGDQDLGLQDKMLAGLQACPGWAQMEVPQPGRPWVRLRGRKLNPRAGWSLVSSSAPATAGVCPLRLNEGGGGLGTVQSYHSVALGIELLLKIDAVMRNMGLSSGPAAAANPDFLERICRARR